MKQENNNEEILKRIACDVESANQKLDKLLLKQPKEVEQPEKLLSVKEVAVMLRIAERTVYKRYYEGKLKSFKMGGNRVFAYSEVMRFLREERKRSEEKSPDGFVKND